MRAGLIGIISLLVLAQIVGAAEASRTWTSKSGETAQGVFVAEKSGKIQLKLDDGKMVTVDRMKMSDADRKYVDLQRLPKVTITVTKGQQKDDRGGRHMSVESREISLKVTIRRGQKPSAAKLRAVALLIGEVERSDNYRILERVEKQSFQLLDEREIVLPLSEEFRSAELGLRDKEVGISYGGYLIAVLDEADNVLAVKSSKSLFEKYHKTIIELDLSGQFNSKGEAVRVSKEEQEKNAPLRRRRS